MITKPYRTLGASLAVAAVLTASACTGSAAKKSAAASAPRSSTSASASGSKPAARGPAANPYLGYGRVPTTPTIVVKIDDTAPGRPQVGIDKADIVYVEAVEAGLTRLAAIFGSTKPTAVGYVRSTRPSDPELLRQYGKITEAFSGGQAVSRNIARKAGLNLWSLGAGRAYYHRVSRSESDYINVMLDTAALAKHVRTTRPAPIGWRFDKSLTGIASKAGTRIQTTVTGTYSSGTPVEFRWNAKSKRYIRYIDGVEQHAADGNPVSAVNVIVQSCQVTTFGADRDVNGKPAQFTHTVGSGPVSVFRQGRRVDGTWSRSKTTAGTVLRTRDGKTLPLNPGNTWVVLIRKGIPVNG